MAAFPAARRDFPLRRPVVAVGLDSVEAAPGGFGGYWGERDGQPLAGTGARITLRFDLYATDGGEALPRLYEALCDHLLLRGSPFGFRRLWCGAVAYDKTADAHRMTARATLDGALLYDEQALPLAGFELRRVESEKE